MMLRVMPTPASATAMFIASGVGGLGILLGSGGPEKPPGGPPPGAPAEPS